MSGDQVERAFRTTRQAARLPVGSVGTVGFRVESGVLKARKTAGDLRRVLSDSEESSRRRPSILVVACRNGSSG